MHLKPKAKIVLAVIVAATFYGGVQVANRFGLIPQTGFMSALVPTKAVLPDVKDAQVQNVTPVALPTSGDASVESVLIRGSIWEWNSQMGLILANGGAKTSKGSLMAKRGVNLQLTRQDDTVKMQEELIACAKEISGGAKQCSTGANFVIIMGDGAGQFAAGVNPQLKKLGDKYQLAVIASPGYSRGEDAFMAPPDVKRDPKNAKGILVAGVLRDGDWNIALKWAGDNGIKNNPDEKTWDADAINWISSADYNAAAADYVAKKCDDRKVVKDGKVTSEIKKVCINAIVTWTPGDVTAVQQRGGLVKVVSSKEYRSQMPSVVIGSRAFFEANRPEVTQMVAAIFEGGDQVKAFDKSLMKAAELSAKLYADQDAKYWYKYFKGVVETDREGNKVELGGSAVNNLADNLILFGLVPGSNDNFRSTYTTFSTIAVQQYPELFKATPIPDVKELEDKSFITGAQAVMNEAGSAADVPSYTKSATGSVVSAKNYSINFDIGKATLTPAGVKQLLELKDSLAITGLFIKVNGYTDNTGDETKNIALSQARAAAIKAFLQAKAPENFPDSRFEVKGHGSSDPVEDNGTEKGRAANRRVQIVLLGE
jgi:outer membrane protein OmpA-like peptidoglycan-associated protein